MATPSLHALLLLSDSALPLGSFAFSSGLESFLGHKGLSNTHRSSSAATKLAAAEAFLEQSIVNLASTALPYVLFAYHNPSTLEDSDNDFDASTPCTVARRASIAQGRALMQIWERALLPAAGGGEAKDRVSAFAIKLKANVVDDFGLSLQAHFAPLFGAVCAALCLSVHDTAYLFLLNHAKAVLSAAVRASVIGPYQSQALLANSRLQNCIKVCIKREAASKVESAAVTVPTMDLWMGRHELLYSRIFNS
ncbi:hypothetical protein DOTSEDRAFT_80557 [Dothistroma septosporum NZE10]|uniref:Urease accessory protein UreF n=1 Tax=Dothistroma septosporum (strain NZE10 / CBS 128990) TaxID=675120 RepID=M2Y3Z9_DOTSN|nr:hypothetical protein DOTSEDRAFT_80557 [Dothistroma septosporum NZE10]